MSKPFKRDPHAEALFPFLAELGEALEQFQRITGESVEVVSIYEIDVTCQKCGRREIRASRDPNSPAEVLGVCDACLDA